MLSPMRVVPNPEVVMFTNFHSQSSSRSWASAFRVTRGNVPSFPFFILADLNNPQTRTKDDDEDEEDEDDEYDDENENEAPNKPVLQHSITPPYVTSVRCFPPFALFSQ